MGQKNEKLFFKDGNELKYIDLVDLKYKSELDLDEKITVKRGGYYGLIDKNGNILIEAIYDKTIKNERIVEKCKIDSLEIFTTCRQGFVGDAGNLILQPNYFIEPFYLDENLFVVRDTLQHKGVINKDGSFIAPIEFKDFDYEVNADESNYLILLKKEEKDTQQIILLTNQKFFQEGKLFNDIQLNDDFFIAVDGDKLFMSTYTGELLSNELINKK